MEVKLGKKYSRAKFGPRGAGVGPGAAGGRGVSGAGSGFRVAWRAAGSAGRGVGAIFRDFFASVSRASTFVGGGSTTLSCYEV